jgi:N-acetylglucosaminyldiphosphoundecaprenol N-acetyl-beta-D-mannosaminyltransferase
MEANPSTMSWRRVSLAGVELDALTSEQLIAYVLASLRDGRGGSVMTPNLDHLRQYRQNPEVRPLFHAASLVVADGKPLVWASHIQGTPLPGRVAGSELILSVTEAAAGSCLRLFLVGGAPGTAERASDVLANRFPGIDLVGVCFPPFGFERDLAEVTAIVNAIKAASPDLVYVGLPFPMADRLILRLREVLPEAWFFALGVSFSFVAGDLRRAPQWMQASGVEWLHRLASEPRRLFRRYLVQGVPFALMLFARALASRLAQPARRRTGRQ